MPLPSDNSAWPPRDRKLYDEMKIHAAWYAGDPDDLARAYGGQAGGAPIDSVDARRPSLRARLRNFFWGRDANANSAGGDRLLKLHVPLAGDIAATSADLLFAEPPTFEIPDDAAQDETTEGADNPETKSDATLAQERLEELIELGGIQNTLLEQAEWAAALGGAYLRPVWDTELVDYPLLTVVQADRAVPEFSFGVLTAVTFWRKLESESGKYIRHLERHERGVILHGLYESSDEATLGKKIDLSAHPETKAYEEEIRVDGLDGLFVRYIPNIHPNRRHRGYQGRSDLQGIETFMDALDETYTSWMRDIRLGQARVLVERQYLESIPGGSAGAWWNIDRAVFTPMDMGPGDADSKPTDAIKPIEFKIRTKEHYDTAIALRDEAVTTAGYSSQTFMPRFEGQAESGTARRMRERRSFNTMGKKERYIRQPVSEIMEILLALDRAVFNRRTPVLRPTMGFSDAAGEGPREVAESVDVLRRAKVASIRTGVEMVHPDWTEDQVAEEVQRIADEEKLTVPTFGLPGEEG